MRKFWQIQQIMLLQVQVHWWKGCFESPSRTFFSRRSMKHILLKLCNQCIQDSKRLLSTEPVNFVFVVVLAITTSNLRHSWCNLMPLVITDSIESWFQKYRVAEWIMTLKFPSAAIKRGRSSKSYKGDLTLRWDCLAKLSEVVFATAMKLGVWAKLEKKGRFIETKYLLRILAAFFLTFCGSPSQKNYTSKTDLAP